MATTKNTRIGTYVNLSPEDHLALRALLMQEKVSLADFFGNYAKKYVAQRRHKLAKLVAEPDARDE